MVIPFTTPLLGGTRARPSDKLGLDLVIPNPSGGQGVYIMGWSGIDALCQPTLHDRELSKRLGAVPNITPDTIRRIAREIAAEGLAGEEAMLAARAAVDHEKGDRTVTNYLLLMNLVEQVGLFRGAPPDKPDRESRARMTVARIAPRIGRSHDWIATALEALGDVMASLGVSGQSAPSRVPRLIAMLRHTCADLTTWNRAQKGSDQASYIEMICITADYTLMLADAIVAQTQALAADLTELLRRWAADSGTIVRLAARPEWLLDGWEQICHIWRCAHDDAERRAALVEIAQLVPVLPREARDWMEHGPEIDPRMALRRSIPMHEDWRTGVVAFELIARNEHIRAATC